MAEVFIGLAPWLSQSPEVCQFSATRLGRRQPFAGVTSLLPKDVHVAGEGREHVQMFVALSHQSGVECAHGGNVPLRFVMQSFTAAAGTAHISNKRRAVFNQRRSAGQVIGTCDRAIVASR